MATITKDILINASPDAVWAVIRDFATCPTRMAPGFVVDTRLEAPDLRVVTFATGAVARERLVGVDDATRRVAYSVVGGAAEPAHDNASMQVYAAQSGTRFVWIHDVLPNDLAPSFAAAMDQGLAAFKAALETPAATPSR